jgi:hypothetical protein
MLWLRSNHNGIIYGIMSRASLASSLNINNKQRGGDDAVSHAAPPPHLRGNGRSQIKQYLSTFSGGTVPMVQ